MKKIGISIAVIVVIIILGLFLIRVKQENTDITQNTTKIGFILNGTIDDHSWGQSHFESMEKTAKLLNLEVDYRECVAEGDECQYIIDDLVAEGCKIIIANSVGFGDCMEAASEKYPEVTFFHATGSYYSDNFCNYFGRIYQIRYLCGIVAGMQTQSNEIGYVAAFPISEVNRGINAFTLGVRSVNPDAKVYVEWTNSWIDDEISESATEDLLANHPDIDVMTVHTDSLKPYEVADAHNIWIIGYNMDNSELYPEHFLTAATWNWDVFYSEEIMAVLQNKFIGKSYWNGLETRMIDLAPLTSYVSTETSIKVGYAKAKLQNSAWDVFYGPIYDNEGNLRVAEGENISDEVLLSQFDWYVDGVVLDN